MANTSSARKAQRASEKKAIFNVRRKRALKDSIKEVGKLTTAKNQKEAEAMLPTVFKAIDKATKRGVLKKNTASRMKSGVVRKIRAIAA